MDITGAELISHFLQSRFPPAGLAVLDGGRALQPLLRAFAKTGLRPGGDTTVEVLAFDFATSLSAAAPILSAAKIERRPLLGIAAQVRRSLIGTDACQPAQVRRQLELLGRQSFHVNAAAELVLLLPAAFELAHHPSHRGPVLLEIPEDVFTEMILGAWIPQLRRNPTRASSWTSGEVEPVSA